MTYNLGYFKMQPVESSQLLAVGFDPMPMVDRPCECPQGVGRGAVACDAFSGTVGNDECEACRHLLICHKMERGMLAIEFPKNKHQVGGVYGYYEFPRERYDQFMAAESKGNFFGQYIKGKDPKKPLFPFRRLAHIVKRSANADEEVHWLTNACPACGDAHSGETRCQ